MSLCASCGLRLPRDVALCPHHHAVSCGDDWANANRLICDFVHRGRLPRRLPETARADDVAAVTVIVEAQYSGLRLTSVVVPPSTVL